MPFFARAQLLETDHVSQQLHHWVDLCFGYLLSGPSAAKAKNVHLIFAQPRTQLTVTDAPVQLFSQPHPRRQPADGSTVGTVGVSE